MVEVINEKHARPIQISGAIPAWLTYRAQLGILGALFGDLKMVVGVGGLVGQQAFQEFVKVREPIDLFEGVEAETDFLEPLDLVVGQLVLDAELSQDLTGVSAVVLERDVRMAVGVLPFEDFSAVLDQDRRCEAFGQLQNFDFDLRRPGRRHLAEVSVVLGRVLQRRHVVVHVVVLA